MYGGTLRGLPVSEDRLPRSLRDSQHTTTPNAGKCSSVFPSANSWITPPVMPPIPIQDARTDAVPDSKMDTLRRMNCPHCGVPLQAQLRMVGSSAPCGFCGKTVVVPEPMPGEVQETKPIIIKTRSLSSKMFQWDCPRCGLSNNTRMTSLGSKIRCKECKLSLILPK